MALRHTGRFDVKYAVQYRPLCKKHPDAKYVAVILRYAKKFAVKYWECTVSSTEIIVMISVDDKVIIPVGEPENQCPLEYEGTTDLW